MQAIASNPCLRVGAFLLAGLSLAIGWGIRGNYGHEFGAMFPGAITAIAVCLLSGREDWRERVAYFAFFGAVGWGFGGSISYMQVLGFTHSGHEPSQVYGFAGLFLIGFLWAALGGAATALPAVLDRKELTEYFKPISLLFLIWAMLYFGLGPLVRSIHELLAIPELEGAMKRHEGALYWFDSDWFQIFVILLGVLAFDFFDRRFEDGFMLPLSALLGATIGFLVHTVARNLGGFSQLEEALKDRPEILRPLLWHAGWALGMVIGVITFLLRHRRLKHPRLENGLWLPFFCCAGALLGYGIQQALEALGQAERIGQLLLRYYDGIVEHPPDELVINWPNFVPFVPQHIGWAAGALVGLGVYFGLFGKFRSGSSLFVHMALGWFAGFLLFPVLLDLRLTPPRGDNWAGVLGAFMGATLYFVRNGMLPVVFASVVCGTIGGLGFAGIALLKVLLISFGHPHLVDEPGLAEAWTEWQQTAEMSMPAVLNEPDFVEKWEPVIAPWRHWSRANWHSFLEQSYGFINGIGVIVALGLLATRVDPLNNDAPRRPWTEIFALAFVLPVLTFVNMVKNLNELTREYAGGHRPVPASMQAPLIESFELSAWGWFALFYGACSTGLIVLMIVHTRRRLAIVPETWLGKGQLLYFFILWVFVIGNFGKALTSFSQGRLLTEGVITLNAVVATILILTLPKDSSATQLVERSEPRFGRLLAVALAVYLLVAATLPSLSTYCVRKVYGDAHAGHSGMNYRFGPKATWKHRPLLKGEQHR